MSPDMGSPFDMLNVHDIAHIEVYKYGQAAAIYGMLGAGGVIPTTYSVVIEGLTANGEIIHEVKQIIVK